MLTDSKANWWQNEFAGCQLVPDIDGAQVDTQGNDTRFTMVSNMQATLSTGTGNGDLRTIAEAGGKYTILTDNYPFRIRRNFTTDITLPEWSTAAGRNEPLAIVKDRHLQVFARFQVRPTTITSLKVYSSGAAPYYGLAWNTINFENGVSKVVSGTESSEYVRLWSVDTGTSGTTVGKNDVIWLWWLKDINGQATGMSFPASVGLRRWSGPHTMYTVLQRPNRNQTSYAPWKVYGQGLPWSEALAQACVWANGATHDGEAMRKVMQHIYDSSGATYDTQQGAPAYTLGGRDQDMLLTNFLKAHPNLKTVNCYDCGKSLTTFANILGCEATYKYSDPFGYVNCIRAIGGTWTNNPFYSSNSSPAIVPDGDSRRTGFGNHAFSGFQIVNGTQTTETIYDACLKRKLSTPLDYLPVSDADAGWVDNMTWSDYVSAVVDLSVGGVSEPQPAAPVHYVFSVR